MSGELELTESLLTQLKKEFGSSFYLFNASLFEQNLDSFKSAFEQFYPNVKLGYSYKTNYIPEVCKIANKKGAYAEVVSGLEYELALKIGCQGSNIIFNGPLKEKEELYRTFDNNSIVHFDSYEEIKVLKLYLNEYPEKQIRCALRCNFDIGENERSRFGFDAENGNVENTYKELFNINGCNPVGIHCHFSTRHRSVKSYKKRTRQLIDLAKKVFTDHKLEYIDIGGGFFGEMPDEIRQLFETEVPSFADYGQAIGELMHEHFPNKDITLILEPGAAVVANTMKFICQVHSIKKIGDRDMAILTGGRHNVRPTGKGGNNPFKVIRHSKTALNLENALIGGYTCMEDDIISQSYTGKLGIGDFVIFDNMGAYNIVFKPPFIKGAPPILEMSAPKENGKIIRAGETLEDIFLTSTF